MGPQRDPLLSLGAELVELEEELGAFSCAGGSLVADLIVVGLATDIVESARTVLSVAIGDVPHKAYPLARLAFESAQHLLVLTTHESYDTVGAQAWVYFEAKSVAYKAAGIRSQNPSDPVDEFALLKRRVDSMAETWDSICQGRGRLLREALDLVWRQRRAKPDNWLHETFTRRQARAYDLFAKSTGGQSSADMETINRDMYQALCHETHAHPRLGTFELRVENVGPSQRIYVDIKDRDREAARRAVAGGTELAVMEATVAVRWRRTGAASAQEE